METSNVTNKIFVLVQKPCEQQLHQEVKNFYIQYYPYSSIKFYNGSLLIVIFYFFRLFYVRWTRREEADFYRVVSNFGVIFDAANKKYDWDKFR